jgi:hypothetical protein
MAHQVLIRYFQVLHLLVVVLEQALVKMLAMVVQAVAVALMAIYLLLVLAVRVTHLPQAHPKAIMVELHIQ